MLSCRLRGARWLAEVARWLERGDAREAGVVVVAVRSRKNFVLEPRIRVGNQERRATLAAPSLISFPTPSNEPKATHSQRRTSQFLSSCASRLRSLAIKGSWELWGAVV